MARKVRLDGRLKLVARAKAAPGLSGRDLVREVTCSEPYHWDQGSWDLREGYADKPESRYRVIANDYGIKRNILRLLTSAGCDVTVVPAETAADAVLAMNPDGIFLSNGPGDPEPVSYAIENIKRLLGTKPIFGICLGQQLLGLALGGRTYKLKFGHHGGNQPIKDLATGTVEIAAENHGFAVVMETVKDQVAITHMNLNDRTCEGFMHTSLPAFSVQYHPEASPGPHDSRYLFTRFVEMMDREKKSGAVNGPVKGKKDAAKKVARTRAPASRSAGQKTTATKTAKRTRTK